MPLEFPMIYLLSSHLKPDELHDFEERIPTLTYDINEAEVVLGKISRKERALFELRRLHVTTEEAKDELESRPLKRRRVDPFSAGQGDGADDAEDLTRPETASTNTTSASKSSGASSRGPRIQVARLTWFTDSLARGEVLPLKEYLLYDGVKVEEEATVVGAPEKTSRLRVVDPAQILARAQKDASSRPQAPSKHSHWAARKEYQEKMPRLVFKKPPPPPTLVRRTTSENDAVAQLPPIPDYLHTQYSCQRPTPINPPNENFIEELKKIRMIRQLEGDKVGIRAYSSAIASLAAYPYSLTADEEVSRLPGCGPKIAELYKEFKNTGIVREAQAAETDPKLKVLKTFYDVWGVADATAREWYNKGWRDLDDVVAEGWGSLSQVQQIGVKFYDEFLLKIPRREVEAIADVVMTHANRLVPGFQGAIVGGYRRGKKECGDVDIVISHPSDGVESLTRNFIRRLVRSLNDAGYIPYTLSLTTKNSERGEVAVSWKGNSTVPGSGFDTLDKALVVWQDPKWEAEADEEEDGDEEDGEEEEQGQKGEKGQGQGGEKSEEEERAAATRKKKKASGKRKKKNPNPHRRVDIIVSPWRTVGCAVLGWSSGITFQRDLRRYCRNELKLKFDSSGVRSRVDGAWVDLEGGGGPLGKAPDMLTAERRVFEGLKLEWRPPGERSTG